MARLILTCNTKVLSTHKVVQEQPLTIGRHPDNHICIDNPAVSSYHAVVHLKGQQAVLRDLGSQNGTFVNDERISEYKLGHQDWIAIGRHIIIVDHFESLSLEVTIQKLKEQTSIVPDAYGTMFVDPKEFQSGYLNYEYLSFLNSVREDFELSHRMVNIGSNSDADIKIGGFWSIFAGRPGASIKSINGVYIIEHVAGIFRPEVNGKKIRKPTRLANGDFIKVGPLKMRMHCVRGPS
jgi:hypothetical protein